MGPDSAFISAGRAAKLSLLNFLSLPQAYQIRGGARHFWRLPEIPGDLAGLSKGPFTLGGISAGYRAAGYRAARYRAGLRCVYTRRETGGKTVGVMQHGNTRLYSSAAILNILIRSSKSRATDRQCPC